MSGDQRSEVASDINAQYIMSTTVLHFLRPSTIKVGTIDRTDGHLDGCEGSYGSDSDCNEWSEVKRTTQPCRGVNEHCSFHPSVASDSSDHWQSQGSTSRGKGGVKQANGMSERSKATSRTK